MCPQWIGSMENHIENWNSNSEVQNSGQCAVEEGEKLVPGLFTSEEGELRG